MKKTGLFTILGGLLLIVGVVGGILTFDNEANTKTLEINPSETPFQSIDIESDITLLNVKRTEDVKAKLEVRSKSGKGIRSSMEVVDGVLYVKLDKKMISLFNIGFDFGNLKATLYLPDKDYEKLYMNSDISMFKVEDLSVEKLDMHVENGTIHLNNVDTVELLASVENGDIKLNTTDLERAMDVSVENGRIYINTDQPPKDVTFDVSVEVGTTQIMGDYHKDSVVGNGEHPITLEVENGMIVVK